MPTPLYSTNLTDIDCSKVAFATTGFITAFSTNPSAEEELGNVDESGTYTDGITVARQPVKITITGTDIAIDAASTITLNGTFGMGDVVGTRIITIENLLEAAVTWYIDNQGLPYTDEALTIPVYGNVIALDESIPLGESDEVEDPSVFSVRDGIDFTEVQAEGVISEPVDSTYFSESVSIGNILSMVDSLPLTELSEAGKDLSVTESISVSEIHAIDQVLSLVDSLSITEIQSLISALSVLDSISLSEVIRNTAGWTKITADTMSWRKTS